MRYAVISDLHACAEALRAVLERADAEAVDRIVCTGDLVGYYTDPDECLQLLRARQAICIAGNHDRMTTGQRPFRCNEWGLRAIHWTRRRMSQEDLEWLARLPLTEVIDEQFLLVHASLHPEPNDDNYLFTAAQAAHTFDRLRTDWPHLKLCFFGHTHHPVIYRWQDGELTPLPPEHQRLDAQAHYLINPGSVGQSRDQDLRASFVIFDSDDRSVRFFRVAFDVAARDRKAQRAGLLHRESLFIRAPRFLSRLARTGRELIRRTD